MKRLISSIITIAFILTQCGLGMAVPVYNQAKSRSDFAQSCEAYTSYNAAKGEAGKAGQNLREKAIEAASATVPQDARAEAIGKDLKKDLMTLTAGVAAGTLLGLGGGIKLQQAQTDKVAADYRAASQEAVDVKIDLKATREALQGAQAKVAELQKVQDAKELARQAQEDKARAAEDAQQQKAFEALRAQVEKQIKQFSVSFNTAGQITDISVPDVLKDRKRDLRITVITKPKYFVDKFDGEAKDYEASEGNVAANMPLEEAKGRSGYFTTDRQRKSSTAVEITLHYDTEEGGGIFFTIAGLVPGKYCSNAPILNYEEDTVKSTLTQPITIVGDTPTTAKVVVARATGAEANAIGRREFLRGAGAIAALTAVGGGAYILGSKQQAMPPAPVVPAPVAVAPRTLPTPSSELMKKVQDASNKIKEIAGENARVTAMWWDTANTRTEDFQTLADFGFNEVIVDGYRWIRGDVDDETIAQFAIAAQKAGIVSFKFMMGDASWAGQSMQSGIDLTTSLCERIARVKKSLEQTNTESAKVLQGIAIDAEPHTINGWNYDLTSYCTMHTNLEVIAKRNGLSYNRIEAFWYTQARTENGRELRGYAAPKNPVYLMSYRDNADATFAMAGFTGNKCPHVAGFDFATVRPTGFKGNVNGCPDALLGATNLSGNDQTRRPNFHGAFVHFPKIEDVRATLESWKAGEAAVKQAKPEEKMQPAPKELPAVEEPTVVPEAPAAKPKPGSVKINMQNHQRAGRTTRFTLKITGLTAEQRERAGVVVLKHTKSDIDYYSPQPYVESIADIPDDGIVEVRVELRDRLGDVSFYVVDKDEYQPREWFTSPREIQGVLAKKGTTVKASLPVQQPVIAFADELVRDAERIASRDSVVAQAPRVVWDQVAMAPVRTITAAAGAAAAGANAMGKEPVRTVEDIIKGVKADAIASAPPASVEKLRARIAQAQSAPFVVLGVTDNLLARDKINDMTKSAADEIGLGNVEVVPLDISALKLSPEDIAIAITNQAKVIKAERVFLWLDKDSESIASALAKLKSEGTSTVEIVVLSNFDDTMAREAIRTSL